MFNIALINENQKNLLRALVNGRLLPKEVSTYVTYSEYMDLQYGAKFIVEFYTDEDNYIFITKLGSDFIKKEG